MAPAFYFETEVFNHNDEDDGPQDIFWIVVSNRGGVGGWGDLEEFLDGLTDPIEQISLSFVGGNFNEMDRLGKLLRANAKVEPATIIRLRHRQMKHSIASLLKPEYFPNVIEFIIVGFDIDVFRAIGSFQDLKKLYISWVAYATKSH